VSWLDRLGARWQKELRLRFIGDPQLCQRHIGTARNQVGIMERQRSLGGVGHAHLFRRYEWGTINTLFDGTTYIAEIEAHPGVEKPTTPGAVWIPQGIVIEPAAAVAPAGWGLPVNVGDGVDPYDPGPEPDRWTPNGPMSQLLLTQADNAGYPELRAVPLYSDVFDASRITIPKLDQPWGAYRAKFRNPGAGKAILDEINDRRDPGYELTPPFFGFANLAPYLQRLIRAFGTDESSYPSGSKTLFQRMEKEGGVKILDDHTASGALQTVSITATDPSGIVDQLSSAIPSLIDNSIKPPASFWMTGNAVAFLNHEDQWIRCGNLDWRSIHPEIPRLSWRGPQGRSIPPNELALGFRSGLERKPLAMQTYINDLETDFQGRKIKVFDNFVYARGRILGVAPDSGYVLGAAIQKIPIPDTTPPRFIYRLIVITWHRADQYCPDGGVDMGYVINFDTTSDVRVYYADLPTRGGIVCHPNSIISGIYDEDERPRGWRFIDRHRLWPFGSNFGGFGPGNEVSTAVDLTFYPDWSPGDTGDRSLASPKTYWQPWFFNGSGTECVCLRASVSTAFEGERAGINAPAQALKISIPMTVEGPTSSISLAWENSQSYFQPDSGSGGAIPIAWDYDGDDEVKVVMYGDGTAWPDVPGASEGYFYHTNGHIVATAMWGSLVPRQFTMYYLDARDMTCIRAFQDVENDVPSEPFAYFVRHVDADVIVKGDVELSFSFDVSTDFYVSYSAFQPFDDVFACFRDEFIPFDYPNPRVIVAMARYGEDYAAGLWWGANPGTYIEFPGFDRYGSWSTQGWMHASSIEIAPYIGENPSWLNFAGVV
jgi:hypothetical protein